MVELFIFIEILSRGLYNPFYTNVSFLYPLKMSENPWFSVIFRAGCPQSWESWESWECEIEQTVWESHGIFFFEKSWEINGIFISCIS